MRRKPRPAGGYAIEYFLDAKGREIAKVTTPSGVGYIPTSIPPEVLDAFIVKLQRKLRRRRVPLKK